MYTCIPLFYFPQSTLKYFKKYLGVAFTNTLEPLIHFKPPEGWLGLVSYTGLQKRHIYFIFANIKPLNFICSSPLLISFFCHVFYFIFLFAALPLNVMCLERKWCDIRDVLCLNPLDVVLSLHSGRCYTIFNVFWTKSNTKIHNQRQVFWYQYSFRHMLLVEALAF